jgi:hypothetical protein
MASPYGAQVGGVAFDGYDSNKQSLCVVNE